jgi:hypothetical protein
MARTRPARRRAASDVLPGMWGRWASQLPRLNRDRGHRPRGRANLKTVRNLSAVEAFISCHDIVFIGLGVETA